MSRIQNTPTEKMSNWTFKVMTMVFKIADFIFFSFFERRVKKFNIQKGITVVDYGCGPGRYSKRFAKKVGDNGLIYAVDIHELAIETVEKMIKKENIKNIKTSLAKGNDNGKYDSKLPDNIADIVFAIDMFFIIKKPKDFLNEIKRILKKDGILIIDDGHQSRKTTKQKINEAGIFKIIKETRDHLNCKIIEKQD